MQKGFMNEERTYVAWSIFADLLCDLDDDQLLVMDRLVRAERKERFRRPDPAQRWLIGGQALQEARR